MEEKLRILMQSENLTASKLAEILEVKPAAISHILSGRNKPSFEMLCKIVNRFPQINPYWLLGDATDMRNSNAPITTSEVSTPSSGTLFDIKSEIAENQESTNIPEPMISSSFTRSDIAKIIVVYNDQTFEVLNPKKIIG